MNKPSPRHKVQQHVFDPCWVFRDTGLVQCAKTVVPKLLFYNSTKNHNQPTQNTKYQKSPNKTISFFKEATLDSYYLNIAGKLPTLE